MSLFDRMDRDFDAERLERMFSPELEDLMQRQLSEDIRVETFGFARVPAIPQDVSDAEDIAW